MIGYETGSWTDELVDTDDLTRGSSNLESVAMSIFNTFVPPRSAMGVSVGTAWTCRKVHCR
jgi:hypothetical protein